MTYFSNITSLAALKKQYRTLAIANHPDKGGDTRIMQAINAEFGKLFVIWKDDTTAEQTATGYESDYAGASANEYTEYVYNEYRWQGCNYKGQSPPEIVDIIRKWLKDTYPHYKFSVTRENYDSIYIYLMRADFEVFTAESEYTTSKQLNSFHLEKDKDLTDRAREVMMNIGSFANSYNFDDSDAMTDYFHHNFYLNLGIGNYKQPYKVVLPKLACRKGDEPAVFKHPEGPTHKAIRQALDNAYFGEYETRRYGKIMVLGSDAFGGKGEHYFYPKHYSSAKTAQKRIDKLITVGIQCKLTEFKSGVIQFLGYTPQTERLLEQEREEVTMAYKQWQMTQQSPIN